jgi:hypothetical protein
VAHPLLVLGALLGAAAIADAIADLFSKPKVFVSYDHSEDVQYKRLLQAWDANPDFNFEFDSRGPDVRIDSDDAGVVKRALTSMMKRSTHLLVLVGEKSAKSKWMAWEIEKAKELRLRLVAVKLQKANETPSCLFGCGARWATSFERDRVVQAIRDARRLG